MSSRRIDNWPPGYYAPEGYVEAPAGLIQRKRELEKEYEEIRNEVNKWYVEMEVRRTRAWIAYHEKRGWPEDKEYKNRMTKEQENGTFSGVD